MRQLSVRLFLLSTLLLPLSHLHGTTFGLKGGINLATQTGYTFFSKSRALFFRVGAYTTVPLSRLLSLQPELHYARTGSDLEVSFGEPGSLFSINGRMKLDYLVLPLLARLSLGTSRTSPYFLFGPYVALNLSAQVTLIADVEGLGQDIRTRDIKDLQSTDIGWVLGCGLSQSLGRMRAILEARVERGLKKLSIVLDDPAQSSVLSFMIGLEF